MSETRFTEVYDSQGNLVAQEPYEVSDEEIAAEAEKERIQQIVSILSETHASHVIPPPGLTEFVLLLCEYITRSQPK